MVCMHLFAVTEGIGNTKVTKRIRSAEIVSSVEDSYMFKAVRESRQTIAQPLRTVHDGFACRQCRGVSFISSDQL